MGEWKKRRVIKERRGGERGQKEGQKVPRTGQPDRKKPQLGQDKEEKFRNLYQ